MVIPRNRLILDEMKELGEKPLIVVCDLSDSEEDSI
jgi:hypothetical protein